MSNSALAQWLVPGSETNQAEIRKTFTPEQLEKFRRHHWHRYFLALRARDDAAATNHRQIAEELERLAPGEEKALVAVRKDRKDKGPLLTPLINREHVRTFLLDFAKQRRAHKFSRVSEETLRLANEFLRQWLMGHVNRMPSKGQTL